MECRNGPPLLYFPTCRPSGKLLSEPLTLSFSVQSSSSKAVHSGMLSMDHSPAGRPQAAATRVLETEGGGPTGTGGLAQASAAGFSARPYGGHPAQRRIAA